MRFLTTVEAAEMLRTTPGALRTQRYRGIAPGALGAQVGARLLFRESDIDRWFSDQKANVGLGGRRRTNHTLQEATPKKATIEF